MKKVMIVEDEKDLGMLLVMLLGSAGYEPYWCENGAAAWERLQKEGTDLAIMDVNMPEMDGLELCQRIRRDARLGQLPVLMLTVRGQVEDQVEGYELGADDYITKPFDSAVLLARVRALERRAHA